MVLLSLGSAGPVSRNRSCLTRMPPSTSVTLTTGKPICIAVSVTVTTIKVE